MSRTLMFWCDGDYACTSGDYERTRTPHLHKPCYGRMGPWVDLPDGTIVAEGTHRKGTWRFVIDKDGDVWLERDWL
jgi:hypothetical protein